MAVQRLARRAETTLAGHGHARQGVIAAALIEGTALTPFFALRMLVASGRTVRVALERDDLPAAREALGSLVSRERGDLGASLVAAAAVESLAENLSDSVVAPLLCYALFGLPGAAFYRLVNTFDSMIGYHGQYEHLGKAAARLDDALNFFPARLTAALIVALAPLFGGDARAAWRIWRRDARRTASPNAGHPMAAAAGALGVQLEKVGHYTLGDARQPVTAATIRQAETMVRRVGGAAILLLAGAGDMAGNEAGEAWLTASCMAGSTTAEFERLGIDAGRRDRLQRQQQPVRPVACRPCGPSGHRHRPLSGPPLPRAAPGDPRARVG